MARSAYSLETAVALAKIQMPNPYLRAINKLESLSVSPQNNFQLMACSVNDSRALWEVLLPCLSTVI